MKETIRTDAAPPAVGPYSQGIRSNGFIFTSGQLPATPTGELVTDDIAAAARRSLENVKAVLEAGGATMEDVVKVTIYLTDMADFAAVNEVYKTFFPAPEPARSCIAVAALPLGVAVEIEAVASKR
ncbi:RidA family protein [Candidatus Bipolaricaulota bacterium]|nr:RidA family protein [Candidatus Bipolaricaulota bacterium]